MYVITISLSFSYDCLIPWKRQILGKWNEETKIQDLTLIAIVNFHFLTGTSPPPKKQEAEKMDRILLSPSPTHVLGEGVRVSDLFAKWTERKGAEAGKKFLEENKTKEGVIVLPSGLQYKARTVMHTPARTRVLCVLCVIGSVSVCGLQVLNEGAGLEHPKVGTPCECHYAGRLLDGSEFDSSYKRGQPTTFAPNQVIKGWTEAMQLMGEGDKWELYIPSELAYGDSKRGQFITPGAVLVFTIEILEVKGASKPKAA